MVVSMLSHGHDLDDLGYPYDFEKIHLMIGKCSERLFYTLQYSQNHFCHYSLAINGGHSPVFRHSQISRFYGFPREMICKPIDF